MENMDPIFFMEYPKSNYNLVRKIKNLALQKKKSNLCNTHGGVEFSMKAEFQNNPILVVSCYITLALILLGFGVRIGER